MFELNLTKAITAKFPFCGQRRNFPKTETFPFDEFYKELVTQIKTTEISAECILFDSVQSRHETMEFRDPDYWKIPDKTENNQWWFFGQNGQRDLWLFDNFGAIYFYDHNQEEMCTDNFQNMGINFEKWLQFADLNKQYEDLYEDEKKHFENSKLKAPLAEKYKERLKEISPKLLSNYPFDI